LPVEVVVVLPLGISVLMAAAGAAVVLELMFLDTH
jgi:hypothetical protein